MLKGASNLLIKVWKPCKADADRIERIYTFEDLINGLKKIYTGDELHIIVDDGTSHYNLEMFVGPNCTMWQELYESMHETIDPSWLTDEQKKILEEKTLEVVSKYDRS
jgi:hypothetical protein